MSAGGIQARLLTLLLACLMTSGCVKTVKSLGEMSRLRAAIVRQFGERDVDVNLMNDKVLTVTFVNSPLNAKDTGTRAQRAEQTAVFINRNYASIDQITKIWVGFVRQETSYIVVTRSDVLDFFSFDKSGHPLQQPEEEPAADEPVSETEPTAIYIPTLDQTEVRITRLQLEGDLDYGFAVAPHFTVPGDATGIRRSLSLPTVVNFDFASYSEKSLFPGEPKITALTDGKVVFETAGQFSTSKGEDEKFFESLSLPIPYPAFQRMIAGKKLTLRIGDREYQFTSEQVAALREMTRYVRDYKP